MENLELNREFFYHALRIDPGLCLGCSRCMRVCPTEAIRIRNGVATLKGDKCIDCGECFRECPASAIRIAEDDLAGMNRYTHRVALVPSVFFGQFPGRLSRSIICGAILQLGFTDIFEIERVAGFMAGLQKDFLQSGDCPNAPVSAYCPAIVRLIQVKFPGLVDTIIPLKPPVDIAASFVRQTYLDRSIPGDEVGLFYFTPCAAKIAALKSPVGEERSVISGVINMNSIYNQVLRLISQEGTGIKPFDPIASPGKTGILWSLTHGEARNIDGRALSIDGIRNVTDFLEKLEDEDLGRIDFLELRACEQSCAGGILVSGNRFLTAEKLYRKAAGMDDSADDQELLQNAGFKPEQIRLDKISPRSSLALDPDTQVAMTRMQQVRSIVQELPGIDCGACGSPGCQSLAEDVVKGEAGLHYCVFRPEFTNLGTINRRDEYYRMGKIWGNRRFETKRMKGTNDEIE